MTDPRKPQVHEMLASLQASQLAQQADRLAEEVVVLRVKLAEVEKELADTNEQADAFLAQRDESYLKFRASEKLRGEMSEREGRFGIALCKAQNDRDAALSENKRLREALNTIAWEPIGDPEDSDGRCYDNIVAIAQAALSAPPAPEVTT